MLNLLTSLSCFVALTVSAPTGFHRHGRRSIPPFSHPETVHSTGACLTSAGLNGTNVTNITATEYSSNWAGAVAVDQSVTSVTGIFTVPRTQAPAQSSDGVQYGAAAWVGIDGWTCGSGKRLLLRHEFALADRPTSAILQTGVSMTVQDGVATYSAWYEWFPDYMRTFSALQVNAGDEIRASVRADSSVSGTAVLENLSTGRTARHTWRDASQLGKLCQANAEWIVEDFSVGGDLIPFADFGTVRFRNVSYVAAGQTRGLQRAKLVDISQEDGVRTSCRKNGASALQCTYLD